MGLTEGGMVVILGVIFVQDTRSRSVHWLLFPALAVLFVAAGLLQHHSFLQLLQTALINILFLVVQFLLVSVYFFSKQKRWVNITAELIGWGDILLLLCVCFYLPVLNYLFFYIASLIMVLVVWIALQAVSRQRNEHIPLAGLQALFLLLFLIVNRFWLHYHLTDDAWLSNLIQR